MGVGIMIVANHLYVHV